LPRLQKTVQVILSDAITPKPILTDALNMKKHLLIVTFVFFFSFYVQAQVAALQHAYAHNDYWHAHPLVDALDNGFTHIEADVYLRHGKLLVAHKPPLFGKHMELEDVYLQPLARRLLKNKNQAPTGMDTIVLVIDIKSNGPRTYNALKNLLSGYRAILSDFDNGKTVFRNLTVVLTGHLPMQLLKTESLRWVFADEKLDRAGNESGAADMFVTASCKYSNILHWDGNGKIPDAEKTHLISLVDKAHAGGQKVRLWGSPENERVWMQLLSCGVDLINTDKLAALRKFLTGDQSSL